MQYIADFHIHSKYSRATSPQMDLEHLDYEAARKGIQVLGTGDFTHPAWFKDLKEKLHLVSEGIYQVKNSKYLTNFILTSELSCIYKKNGKCRRIHLVFLAPSLEVVEKINKKLDQRFNIRSDGRPILGVDVEELTKLIFDISPKCFLICAHIWTPWFSLFGAKSGFDTVEECFGEMSSKVYAMETGLSCYDKKTEVLTITGWKKFSEIHDSDKICTLNIKTDEIEFQKPRKMFSYKYEGKMYKLKTKRVDLLVTPNHKLLFSPCNFRKPPHFSLKTAESLFNKSKRFKKDGIWIGDDIEIFTLPAVKIKHGSQYYSGWRNKKEKHFPIRPWLKFFGFWIAEGWTTQGKNGDYNVYLANQDKILLSEMKQILQDFGYNVYQGNDIIRVRDYQLFHYLKQFGKSADKFFPLELKSLSKELLEILFIYYIKGDGHVYGRSGKGLSATTISVRLRDDLQEIALKIGISAYYKLGRKRGAPFHGGLYKDRIYKQSEDSWVIYFIRKNKYTILPSTIKKYNYIESWVDFKGSVFCVSVPNQVIYVRRNGIPLWCGNSDPAMNWRLSALDKYTLLSNSDAHSPRNLGREANVFDLKKLTYSNLTNAIKTKKGLEYTIEFYPEEGKYHLDGHRACDVKMTPQESIKNKNICPQCHRPLTIGVLHRVNELADRPEGFIPSKAIPFKSIIPLPELISEIKGVGPKSKTVQKEYDSLISKGQSEFNILLNLSQKELEKISSPELALSIIKMRKGDIVKEEGYDGIYGRIRVKGIESKKNSPQKKLF